MLAAIPNVYTASDPDAADPLADLKWTLSGADASKFELSEDTGATRTLAFKANPDFESPGDSGGDNVYEVTLVVTDSKGNSDEQDVTVKVTNIEEDGEITFSTLQPRVGFPVAATLTDPDIVTADSVSWQWYRGTPSLGTLTDECAQTTAGDCAIKGAASDTYTPIADDVAVTLSAVALYTDGSPNDPTVTVNDGKDGVVAPAANPVLANTRNKAPVFPDQDLEIEGSQTARSGALRRTPNQVCL